MKETRGEGFRRCPRYRRFCGIRSPGNATARITTAGATRPASTTPTLSRGVQALFSRDRGRDRNRGMTPKRPPTHRAYCVLREGRRAPGRWLEAGFASVAEDGCGLLVYLQMLPVLGFDGHILLRPVDAKPSAPLPPNPDDELE